MYKCLVCAWFLLKAGVAIKRKKRKGESIEKTGVIGGLI
jgi:hypothetical protein